MNTLSLALMTTLCAAPVAAWAGVKPDFDDDARPILRMQPGLLQYVEHNYEVKETGAAKFPGTDDRPPGPPFIFRARPAGSEGPYNLRLLIQPGHAGHILGVVDITKVHLHTPPDEPFSSAPAVASRAPITSRPTQSVPATSNPNVQVPELSAGAVDQQAPAAPQAQAPTKAPTTPAQQPSEPTADTPSGPITDSSSSNQAPASNQPNLAPPPDPAPPAQ